MQTFTLALVNLCKGIIETAAGREQNVQDEERNSKIYWTLSSYSKPGQTTPPQAWAYTYLG